MSENIKNTKKAFSSIDYDPQGSSWVKRNCGALRQSRDRNREMWPPQDKGRNSGYFVFSIDVRVGRRRWKVPESPGVWKEGICSVAGFCFVCVHTHLRRWGGVTRGNVNCGMASCLVSWSSLSPHL